MEMCLITGTFLGSSLVRRPVLGRKPDTDALDLGFGENHASPIYVYRSIVCGAFWSRTCVTPHAAHVHVRSDKVNFVVVQRQ